MKLFCLISHTRRCRHHALRGHEQADHVENQRDDRSDGNIACKRESDHDGADHGAGAGNKELLFGFAVENTEEKGYDRENNEDRADNCQRDAADIAVTARIDQKIKCGDRSVDGLSFHLYGTLNKRDRGTDRL